MVNIFMTEVFRATDTITLTKQLILSVLVCGVGVTIES
jgi:hypothetical protein